MNIMPPPKPNSKSPAKDGGKAPPAKDGGKAPPAKDGVKAPAKDAPKDGSNALVINGGGKGGKKGGNLKDVAKPNA